MTKLQEEPILLRHFEPKHPLELVTPRMAEYFIDSDRHFWRQGSNGWEYKGHFYDADNAEVRLFLRPVYLAVRGMWRGWEHSDSLAKKKELELVRS